MARDVPVHERTGGAILIAGCKEAGEESTDHDGGWSKNIAELESFVPRHCYERVPCRTKSSGDMSTRPPSNSLSIWEDIPSTLCTSRDLKRPSAAGRGGGRRVCHRHWALRTPNPFTGRHTFAITIVGNTPPVLYCRADGVCKRDFLGDQLSSTLLNHLSLRMGAGAYGRCPVRVG